MSLEIINGDLLTTKCEYICHQVNCQGAMNSGVAKAIREKWPIVYTEYKNICDNAFNTAELLGEIQIISINENQKVINLFGQNGYGYNGFKYTSYDAFWGCINQITFHIPKGSTIAFPYKIGSDRGGANWTVILSMIYEVLSKDYIVYIYNIQGE